MKIFNEELNERHERKKRDKSTYWTNWIIKIIILVFLFLLLKQFGSDQIRYLKESLFGSNLISFPIVTVYSMRGGI